MIPVMVKCDRLQMSLTEAGCVRLWKSAQDPENRPQAHEGRHHCLGCPLGAMRAGVDRAEEVSAATQAKEAIRPICPRCERPALRIIEKRLCISCYNRDREARVGRNARGGTPGLAAKLYDDRISVARGARIEVMAVTRITSRAEAMLRIGRADDDSGPIRFGVPPGMFQPNGWQMELPL